MLPDVHHTAPSHCGALSLIKKVIQSHKEISRLHLCTLAPCYVTAAAALTALYGAVVVQCSSNVTLAVSAAVQVMAQCPVFWLETHEDRQRAG